MLRGVRWSSLAVVLAASVLALLCLVLALRGRPWAWLVGFVCAATAVREVRALQRLDRRAGGPAAARRARAARGPRA